MTAYYESSLGFLKISCENGGITEIKCVPQPGPDHTPCPVSDQAAAQFLEYFAGSRKAFDLPLAPKGTPFQQSVWQALLQIPYGQTRSYGQIAASIGSPGASRAIGMACNKNPIWIAIPCHRVLGRGQALTGYAGGLAMKQALLTLEQVNT